MRANDSYPPRPGLGERVKASCPRPLRERVVPDAAHREPGEGSARHTPHPVAREARNHPLPETGARAKPLRLAFALVGLLFAPPAAASPTPPDADQLAAADAAFARGVSLRDDAAAARPEFARAAGVYDAVWRTGVRSPELALNRANAHRLAGNLPEAVVALNEGLAAARSSRPLQVALEEARAAVAYPVTADLAAQCRPVPPRTVGTRMSPVEAWLVAGALWLLACAGVARFAMTRTGSWLAFAAAGVAGLAALGGLWRQDADRLAAANEHPLVVVAADALLRKGNADAYPGRLEPKLPKGVEARELARRGGWVQVRLAGGAVGWLPASAVRGVG